MYLRFIDTGEPVRYGDTAPQNGPIVAKRLSSSRHVERFARRCKSLPPQASKLIIYTPHEPKQLAVYMCRRYCMHACLLACLPPQAESNPRDHASHAVHARLPRGRARLRDRGAQRCAERQGFQPGAPKTWRYGGRLRAAGLAGGRALHAAPN